MATALISLRRLWMSLCTRGLRSYFFIIGIASGLVPTPNVNISPLTRAASSMSLAVTSPTSLLRILTSYPSSYSMAALTLWNSANTVSSIPLSANFRTRL